MKPTPRSRASRWLCKSPDLFHTGVKKVPDCFSQTFTRARADVSPLSTKPLHDVCTLDLPSHMWRELIGRHCHTIACPDERWVKMSGCTNFWKMGRRGDWLEERKWTGYIYDIQYSVCNPSYYLLTSCWIDPPVWPVDYFPRCKCFLLMPFQYRYI